MCDGTIASWNPAAERLFGYSASEAVGTHVSVLWPSDSPNEGEAFLDEARRGRAISQFDAVKYHKDGTAIDVSITLSPCTDETGQVIGFSAIFRDITERKRTRETLQTLLKQNSFLIWRGGSPANFELKAEFRISPNGNSGINYRSVEVPGTKWLMLGYQADIDGANKYTGQNYEERGRTFLAPRGTVTYVATGQKPAIIASLGSADDLKAFIKPGDWNQYHLVVRGNLLIHILNGHIMSEVIDDDTANRKFSGLIGVQVHVGPPMKIEYRTFLLKVLP